MIRFGLCCIFKEENIKFRRTTAKYLSSLPRVNQLKRLSEICLFNILSLKQALIFCRDHGIGDFRINSQILPLKTHPEVGYDIHELPDEEKIMNAFSNCRQFSRANDIRTGFHPDQFIVLSSPRPEVVRRSVADLVYQAEVSQLVGSDVINIHGGGVYGDKTTALERLVKEIKTLPDHVRKRLTLENDDRSYTPDDLLPVCIKTGVPLVYDIHHHRCLKDGLNEKEATQAALSTWNREPLFHISSPRNGWDNKDIRKHHDYIDPSDFPAYWLPLDITVEVEAKAKELAVTKLINDLKKQKGSL
ncbi:MAG: UV DNA damage repair endonuclease UvsE [Desulfobacterales bacterium]|nr:UV DNA damage repair endonuclease UvsE [Desulfobacterales bacterium]